MLEADWSDECYSRESRFLNKSRPSPSDASVSAHTSTTRKRVCRPIITLPLADSSNHTDKQRGPRLAPEVHCEPQALAVGPSPGL